MTQYCELQVTSNYSFLHGASHPDELASAAAALGLSALAVTDRNSVAGIVRAHGAARQAGIRLLPGARLEPTDGMAMLCLPTDRAAWGRLTRLLTLGRRRADKGSCAFTRAELADHADGQVLIALPPPDPDADFAAELAAWGRDRPGRVFLAASRRFDDRDRARLADLDELAGQCATPLVATNDVLMHVPERRPLLDVLTCIRLGTTITAAGWALAAHAERHLKPPEEMARLFARHPDAITRTADIALLCRFSLDQLRYEYPDEEEGDGQTPHQRLARLVAAGAAQRYPTGIPAKVQAALAHEMALIGQLGFAPYFLTVEGIVRFARQQGILCQGRGSAANSAVCFCLGITNVDPAVFDLLFERFISAERGEPPDIDVDFEHERREEVIQHIYARHGRDRAGLTATVIHYRARSAVREVGRALGLSDDSVAALAKTSSGYSSKPIDPARVRELGLDPDSPALARVLDLAAQLTGFPRHLSQHVGGFVVSRHRLDELVPIENARMDGRTVIEWDKDDLDTLGMVKVDVLALGMLTCIRKAFALLADHCGIEIDLATVPREDPAVYDMLGRADSIGVFQVESRAQMTMLPRLKPRCFYDLVIEVAIVRPGPIQGDMVHPYLRRRQGLEKVEYPSPELERVLGKTLGVPLFQEQVMQIAIVAAGFTPAEADQLRRSMAAFCRTGQVGRFRDKLITGMRERGYTDEFAERVFRQIEGFAEYGFPESHAASFAHLVYVSAWLKCHHPAAFACALLNSQPMGFYAPAQIVRDAQDHGIEVRSVDVSASDWDNRLEERKGGGLALRLGLRQIDGLPQAGGRRLAARRPYGSFADLVARTGLTRPELERLARADAFGSLKLSRRDALWQAKALTAPPPPLLAALAAAPSREPAVSLPTMGLGEEVVHDYASLRLSLKAHPLALLRPNLDSAGVRPAADLARRQGGRIAVAGLVLVRQRPGTASGVIFLTLEDESGIANIVVWPTMFEAARKAVLTGRLLRIDGTIQREGPVVHVVAKTILDMTGALGLLVPRSRDFC
ncbi:error-prone DNA polymerase [Magnetospirillum moscoviense]|uniref:Error-prone DNA polymerase n=1 Tax=Magnetospirillum moscoviense TaxID=1437059 RepID=A0A178MN56_9PROT|nr:error-prone DNA polymerase [Magnetospirillum moscoviense]OAN50106.1 error-prone DNA polymerase [Magnetospirillum moscoviense]